MSEVLHPLTEMRLSEERYLPAIRETEAWLQEHMWDKTRPVRERLLVLKELVKPTLPAVRYRTEKQAKIARCPRCHERLEP